jgi:hypothetical protein
MAATRTLSKLPLTATNSNLLKQTEPSRPTSLYRKVNSSQTSLSVQRKETYSGSVTNRTTPRLGRRTMISIQLILG